MSTIIPEYGEHVALRNECGQRFGPLPELRIIKPHKVIKQIIGTSDGSILDFGCGQDQYHKTEYEIPDNRYFSLDNDPQGDFSFRNLGEIPSDQRFSLVIMNQVIEHMAFQECVATMATLKDSVDAGGQVLVTVPNVQHPVRYWGDLDHVTPWSFEDIYAIFRRLEFDVEQIGRFNKYRLPLNPIKRFVLSTVCQGFRIDWCDSIVVVGRKKD